MSNEPQQRLAENGEFDAFWRSQKALIRREAQRCVSDPNLVDDIMGETALAISRMDSVPYSPKKWLKTVVNRSTFKILKWRRNSMNVDTNKLAERLSKRYADPLESEETSTQIRNAIDRLPCHLRKILLFSLDLGMSPKEIAEILGLKTNTVHVYLGRARSYLRKMLSHLIEGD